MTERVTNARVDVTDAPWDIRLDALVGATEVSKGQSPARVGRFHLRAQRGNSIAVGVIDRWVLTGQVNHTQSLW